MCNTRAPAALWPGVRAKPGRGAWRRAAGAAALLATMCAWPRLALAQAGARAELAPWAAVIPRAPRLLSPGAEAWAELGVGAMRGVTIGPIESLRHPDRGYGTEASARALDEAVRMGATWISLTPFGRVWDLRGRGVDLVFEAPFEDNRAAVLETIHQAHARGLRVFLVPHLWVESGGWRALIDPGDEEGWARWAASYRDFLLTWTDVASEGQVEMLSLGVELRSWVTTARVQSFLPIIDAVRARYGGLLTYSANWDDVADTMILDELDVIGINAFYPLTEREGATRVELAAGGRKVASGLAELADTWQRPVLLTEIGYTTRRDPALKPWEWPDGMRDVVVDEGAQADAYHAIIAPLLDARWCAGFFVWRLYADPGDVSQEAEWGFSPRGKLAELVMRDAFTAPWRSDGPWWPGAPVGSHRARTPGLFMWELDPSPPYPPWPPWLAQNQ